MIAQTELFASAVRPPLVVNLGAGRDSTAVLVGLAALGIRPDLIIFADVGAEKKETYEFIPILNEWCLKVGFPPVTVTRYQVQDYKHWPPYFTLEENCLTNCTVPGIAVGPANCSGKWKSQAIHNWVKKSLPEALNAWSHGGRVRKAIGFEHCDYERGRAKNCRTFAIKHGEAKRYDIWFPLQEWKWTLDDCINEIRNVGLPVPPKSSCFFCLAMKPHEVDELPPDKLKRIIIIEARAKPRLHTIHGLWRKPVKGCRGATPRPGSMTEYIRQRGLLPKEEVDRLIAATPTERFSKSDFDKLGYSNWQDWIASITQPQTTTTE